MRRAATERLLTRSIVAGARAPLPLTSRRKSRVSKEVSGRGAKSKSRTARHHRFRSLTRRIGAGQQCITPSHE
jgi:hypothetical protein